MRLTVETSAVRELSNDVAAEIVSRLTKVGSEFQQEVSARVTDTPIAVVSSGGRVLSWAATHDWNGHKTVECFTEPDSRRDGLATLAAAALVVSARLEQDSPVAVFSPACISIARQVGFRDVSLFEFDGGGWVEVDFELPQRRKP